MDEKEKKELDEYMNGQKENMELVRKKIDDIVEIATSEPPQSTNATIGFIMTEVNNKLQIILNKIYARERAKDPEKFDAMTEIMKKKMAEKKNERTTR